MRYLILFFIFLCLLSKVYANERLFIAGTTSIRDSGLMEQISKAFETEYSEYGYELIFLIQGTRQSITIAKRGDVDVLLTHNKELELDFVDSGYGIKRYNLMYNNFVIVGPKHDPALVRGSGNMKNVMTNIFNTKSNFVSRGDQSGTHLKELELWKNSGLDVNNFENWYNKIGQGMGATLNMANSIKAYTISDRATWLNFNNKDNLKIVFENDSKLINQYAIILVDHKKNSVVNKKSSEVFLKWILSDKGRKLINNFRINNEQLFFFNGNL